MEYSWFKMLCWFLLDSSTWHFLINDLGQRFQICWAHRIHLFSGNHLKQNWSRAWRLGGDAQREIKSSRPWPSFTLDCPRCRGCSILVLRGAEVHAATLGCCNFQKWCFRANSALLNRTNSFGSCHSVGWVSSTWQYGLSGPGPELFHRSLGWGPSYIGKSVVLGG